MTFKDTTIKELHTHLVSKEISPKDLLEESMSVITERDESIHAFIEVFDDQTLDVDVNSGVLAGIPVAIKDNILFKGKKVSGASKMLENYTASYDSKVAEIFNKQNAIREIHWTNLGYQEGHQGGLQQQLRLEWFRMP